jgi:hypothetical protein
MKTCYKCELEKPLSDYGKDKRKSDGLAITCLDCKREYNRDYHVKTVHKRRASVRAKYLRVTARNHAYVDAYLSTHPCVDCGETDLIVLEFDHVRGTKTKNVGDMISREWSVERLQAEIDKCEVRCANDHRRVTHQRRLAVKA